jgi:hypothetical protein
MIWAVHVAHTEWKRNVYNILVRKPERRDHLEDSGITGKVILK